MSTTVEKVRTLIDTGATDGQVEGYISGALSHMTAVIKEPMDQTLKDEIQAWLAAHMIAVSRERTSAKEGAGGAFIEYTGIFGEGLTSTPYGQMVIALDATGAFRELSLNQKKATFRAIPS